MTHNTPHLTTTHTLANADWDAFVSSAKSAATDLADAQSLFIIALILAVLYINFRLAKFLSTPHHHAPKHHSNHK